MKKYLITMPLVALAAVGMLVGCGSKTSSVVNDQAVTNNQLDRYQKNQPVPAFDWSQERETLISLLNARAHTVATTSFFYNMGSNKPIDSCPSIGFPVPTTAQLTNPSQVAWSSTNGNTAAEVVGQAEPTGIYTGDSQGTYVVCVAPGGQKFVEYWEGNVNTVGGPAHWDPQSQQIVLDGAPTVQVKTK